MTMAHSYDQHSDRAPLTRRAWLHRVGLVVPALVAAVEWARGLGCDFDLGGVPMTGDTDEKRLSIAQFKRDFSKTRVELIGQYSRWLIP